MRKLTWLQKRRLNAAIKHIDTVGELSFSEVFARVSGLFVVDRHAMVYELSQAIAEGKITVRYDAVKDGCCVESQTSVLDFGSDVDIFSDVEIIYMKAMA